MLWRYKHVHKFRTASNRCLRSTWFSIQGDLALAKWILGFEYHVTMQFRSVNDEFKLKASSSDEICLVLEGRVKLKWCSEVVNEVQGDTRL